MSYVRINQTDINTDIMPGAEQCKICKGLVYIHARCVHCGFRPDASIEPSDARTAAPCGYCPAPQCESNIDTGGCPLGCRGPSGSTGSNTSIMTQTLKEWLIEQLPKCESFALYNKVSSEVIVVIPTESAGGVETIHNTIMLRASNYTKHIVNPIDVQLFWVVAHDNTPTSPTKSFTLRLQEDHEYHIEDDIPVEPNYADRANKFFDVMVKQASGEPLNKKDNEWVSFALGIAYRVELDMHIEQLKRNEKKIG